MLWLNEETSFLKGQQKAELIGREDSIVRVIIFQNSRRGTHVK
jgi:hypothetical protein